LTRFGRNERKPRTFAFGMEDPMKLNKFRMPLSAVIIAGSLIVLPVAGFAQTGGGAAGGAASGGGGTAGTAGSTGTGTGAPGTPGSSMQSSPYAPAPGSNMTAPPNTAPAGSNNSQYPSTSRTQSAVPNGSQADNPNAKGSQCPAGSTECLGNTNNTGSATPQ
jgi:hypothetical protein